MRIPVPTRACEATILMYSPTDLQAVEQVRRTRYHQLHNQVLTHRSQHRPEVVEAALDVCLAELELDYLDV